MTASPIRASRSIAGIGTHHVEPARDLPPEVLNGRIALEPQRDTLGGGTRVRKVDEHLGIMAIAFRGRDAEDFGIEAALACDGPDKLTELFKLQCHDSSQTQQAYLSWMASATRIPSPKWGGIPRACVR